MFCLTAIFSQQILVKLRVFLQKNKCVNKNEDRKDSTFACIFVQKKKKFMMAAEVLTDKRREGFVCIHLYKWRAIPHAG
jgi:hypothetical protein